MTFSANLLFGIIFAKNCMNKKKHWTERGRISLGPPRLTMACYKYFMTDNSKSPKHINLCGEQPEVSGNLQPEVPVYLQPEVVGDVHWCTGTCTRNRFESSRWEAKVAMRVNVGMLRHCSCHIVCPSLPPLCLPHPRARLSSSHQLLLTRTQLPQFVPFRDDLLTPVQCIRTQRLPSPSPLHKLPIPFLSFLPWPHAQWHSICKLQCLSIRHISTNYLQIYDREIFITSPTLHGPNAHFIYLLSNEPLYRLAIG